MTDTINHYLCQSTTPPKPDAPLKVGDWVETQNLELAEHYVRQSLARLTWPRKITRINAVNLTIEGLDSYVAQLFFRRVPPPSEKVESKEKWDAVDDTALSNEEIDALVDDWIPERSRIAALERERDELRQQLEAVTRERDATSEGYRELGEKYDVAKRQIEWLNKQLYGSDGYIETAKNLRIELNDRAKERDQAREQLSAVQAEAAARARSVPNPTKQGPTNCFAACVASLLMVDIDSVPGVDGEKDWDWLKFQSWLRDKHGLQAVEMTFENGGTMYPTGHPTPCVLSGPSPRLDGKLHAVCALLDGSSFTLTHDPHQIEEWIDGEPTHATFFVPTDTTAGRELLDDMQRKDERIAELERQLAEQAPLVAIARDIVDAISDGGFLTGESNSPKFGEHQVVIKFRDIHKMQRLYSALIALGVKLRDAKGGE